MRSAWTSVSGLALLAPAALTGSALAAQTELSGKDAPQVLQNVVDCRAIADDQARLDCYDRRVAALVSAYEGEEIVVADQTQVRQARRGLFGLSLPNIRIFGGADDEIKEIEGVVRSVAQGPDRKFVFTLEDGAVWRQTDTVSLRKVTPGTPMLIKKGSMGLYLAKVGENRFIRVMRAR